MSTSDNFGDRMKEIEARETSRRFFQTLPIYARIDGRSFSKFTKGMERPFDPAMTKVMLAVADYLLVQSGALVAYTQSDEISLLWQAPNHLSDIFFKGKTQKMCSVLASMAAAKMAMEIKDWYPYCERMPHFDCRIMQMPSQIEAANMFYWRSLDAQKNAVSAAAQANFSHRELQGRNQADMLRMLAETVGPDYYANLDRKFRLGTFSRRITSKTPDVRSYVEHESISLRETTWEDRTKFIFEEAYVPHG